jgi:hypothetical protein
VQRRRESSSTQSAVSCQDHYQLVSRLKGPHWFEAVQVVDSVRALAEARLVLPQVGIANSNRLSFVRSCIVLIQGRTDLILTQPAFVPHVVAPLQFMPPPIDVSASAKSSSGGKPTLLPVSCLRRNSASQRSKEHCGSISHPVVLQ